MNRYIKKLIISALFLALALVLPFLTGQIKQFGNALLPMHIPVLLCGFVSGPAYGAAVGFLSPILRSFMFGMPPVFPEAVSMMFELCCYGTVSGLLYNFFPKKNRYIYITLLLAMASGRLVWGIVRYIFAIWFGIEFSVSIFVSGAFLTSIPGMILQIILIPTVIIILKKVGVVDNE